MLRKGFYLYLNFGSQQKCGVFVGLDRVPNMRDIIFKEGELEENQVCAKNARTGSDGKKYQIEYYKTVLRSQNATSTEISSKRN